MKTIVTHVHLKPGAGQTGTPSCVSVCRPQGSDRVGWEANSSGPPIRKTRE